MYFYILLLIKPINITCVKYPLFLVVSSIVVVVVVVQIAMINAKLHVPKMVPQGEIDVLARVSCLSWCLLHQCQCMFLEIS